MAQNGRTLSFYPDASITLLTYDPTTTTMLVYSVADAKPHAFIVLVTEYGEMTGIINAFSEGPRAMLMSKGQ